MPRTALVVDDAGIVRQVCTMALRREGYEVIEAVDGKDALVKIEGKGLDLVVTDINMPEMDGIELIKQLRLRHEFRFVPIIVLSTLSQKHKVQEGKDAGATGWVFKPFDANKLLAAVRRLV